MSNTVLTDILREAIGDYQASASSASASEWLRSYLGEKLTNKTSEEINAYSDEISDTINFMEKKQAEMVAASERGISAENWAAKELTQNAESNGELARESAILLNDLNAAQDVEADVIDVEATEWSDDKWNDYKLKDTVKGVAAEAGMAGLREIASSAFQKAAEDGIESLADKEFLAEAAVSGAQTGLKYAVSAGLAIAEDRGAVSPLGAEAIGAIAHRTIESASALVDVARGKRTMTEALVHIKNTAVVTVTGIVQRNKERITNAVATAASKVGTVLGGGIIGKVFGTIGAAISGAVVGLVTPKKDESRVKTVIKEAGKAVWGFLTKERHIPFVSSIKEKAKNFLGALFG